jgi:Fe-S oxidoreductase
MGSAVFWDSQDLQQEVGRVLEICRDCRICSHLCPSFKVLFASPVDQVSPGSAPVPGDLERLVDLCYQCQRCLLQCPYAPPHERSVDFPQLMERARLSIAREEGGSSKDRFLGNADLIGAVGSLFAPLSNWLIGSRPGRWVLEKSLGIHRERSLPRFRRRTFDRWFQKRRRKIEKIAAGGGGKALLIPTCTIDYGYPEMAVAATQVLLHNDVKVMSPPTRCCGLHHLEAGNLEGARANAEANVRALRPYVESGFAVVVLQPACAHMMKVKVPWLLGSEEADKVAGAVRTLAEFLLELHEARRLRHDFSGQGQRFVLHRTCLERTLNGNGGGTLLDLIPGTRTRVVERCSGMGGLWGWRARHDEAVRKGGAPFFSELDKGRDEVVVSDCIFTGLRVEERMGTRARHVAEVLRDAYRLSPKGELPKGEGEKRA